MKDKLFGEYTPNEMVIETDYNGIEPFKRYDDYTAEELKRLPPVPKSKKDKCFGKEPYMWNGSQWILLMYD